VLHEVDSPGSKSVNGSWSGMMALVISGNADIGVSPLYVTKERSEVITFTDTLGSTR